MKNMKRNARDSNQNQLRNDTLLLQPCFVNCFVKLKACGKFITYVVTETSLPLNQLVLKCRSENKETRRVHGLRSDVKQKRRNTSAAVNEEAPEFRYLACA